MRLLAKEGAKRLRFHQGTHVLAVDREQALGARVLGMVGLCLLEYFVGERPQHVAQQLLALAGPAVERRTRDFQLRGERAHVYPPALQVHPPRGVKRGGRRRSRAREPGIRVAGLPQGERAVGNGDINVDGARKRAHEGSLAAADRTGKCALHDIS